MRQDVMHTEKKYTTLQEERLRRHWSQREVAEKLGTTRITISRWEAGKTFPSAYFRQLLGEVFGMSAEELRLIPSIHALHEISDRAEEASAKILPQHNTPITCTLPFLQCPSEVVFLNYNRTRLLRRLRRTYRELLHDAVPDEYWIAGRLMTYPDAVYTAVHVLQPGAHRPGHTFPQETPLISAYEEAEEELLLLGAPGSGKSLLLLSLAQTLVMRAEKDETRPLPVIIPLSSWTTHHLPIERWLSEQISCIYDMPRTLSHNWMRQHYFIPLLDGLDEIDEPARLACLKAINTYHRASLGPIVVCSRTHEYEAVAVHQRLAVQNAVVVY